jgi:hypothetical protein
VGGGWGENCRDGHRDRGGGHGDGDTAQSPGGTGCQEKAPSSVRRSARTPVGNRLPG